MLALTSEQSTAIAARRVMRRMFIWCEARDPDTGDPDPRGFWTDIGDIEHEGRTYLGSGNVITVASLGSSGALTIPGIEITLSGIADPTNVLVRGKEIAQAPVEVSIGLFDPDTHTLIGPLVTYFTGFLDDVEIRTPAAGGESVIVFTCESTSRALTRKSTATRSAASHSLRDPADKFFDYTGAQRGKPLYFGQKAPATTASAGGGR